MGGGGNVGTGSAPGTAVGGGSAVRRSWECTATVAVWRSGSCSGSGTAPWPPPSPAADDTDARVPWHARTRNLSHSPDPAHGIHYSKRTRGVYKTNFVLVLEQY